MLVAVLLLLVTVAAPTLAQFATPTVPDESALNAPVTALAVRGDYLLIGQNTQLIDAAITADNLTVNQSVDLAHGAIRAIAIADNGAVVVITEDGLIALDAHNVPTDYAPGGGYRVALHGERVYVAALAAGVRIYTLHSGKLASTGHITTAQPAEDIAPEGANDLWVATGSGGLQLYDLTTPNQPLPIYDGQQLAPAHLVRASGLHLLVSYGHQIALLDTINIKTPRVIGSLALDGSAGVQIGDILFNQSNQSNPNDVLLGRVDVSGADVLYTTLTPSGLAPVMSQDGIDGAGERLARFGDDVFIGSERTGLRRVHIAAGSFVPLNSWPVAHYNTCALADYTPSQPSPANMSAIASADSVTLRWQAACLAVHYQVLINGLIVATVDQPTYRYTIPAGQNVMNWQVKAQFDNGAGPSSIDGALWSLSFDRAGYLITPPVVAPNAPSAPNVLYVPPPAVIDLSVLQSPGWLLAESCLVLLIGIGVVVGGAWAIGMWAARRRQ
jgi:hypothetical protein